MTHPKATPNPLVETKGITLREAQKKLCSGPIFSFWEKSNQLLEDGIYSAAAVWGWGQEAEAGEKESSLGNAWWIPSEILCCIPLSAAQENEAGCGDGSESAPLHIFDSWH